MGKSEQGRWWGGVEWGGGVGDLRYCMNSSRNVWQKENNSRTVSRVRVGSVCVGAAAVELTRRGAYCLMEATSGRRHYGTGNPPPTPVHPRTGGTAGGAPCHDVLHYHVQPFLVRQSLSRGQASQIPSSFSPKRDSRTNKKRGSHSAEWLCTSLKTDSRKNTCRVGAA